MSERKTGRMGRPRPVLAPYGFVDWVVRRRLSDRGESAHGYTKRPGKLGWIRAGSRALQAGESTRPDQTGSVLR